jgi:adenylate cyclase, class 2
MAKDGIEVEVKIPVSKELFEKTRKFLKRNASFISFSCEMDRYFNSPHRNFLSKGNPTEYLRVRIKEKGGSMAYKNVHLNNKGERTHSDEYESKVDNPMQAVKILEVLNFDNFLTVDKDREEYIYKNIFEIDMDIVKGLGYFVEIEALRNFGGIQKTRKRICNFARKLGIDPDNQDKKGYVIALMEKKGIVKS